MDYSGRVNSKQGSGGVADTAETNVHVKRRIKELLATQVLDLDNDPYVFRNHLGLLECKLCLTTHVSESSYISHLGGRKHLMNLEKRRLLDEKYNNNNKPSSNTENHPSINNTVKRTWHKIGVPAYKVSKVRDPESYQTGILFHVKLPRISASEPLFRIMSYYELLSKNQNVANSFLQRDADADAEPGLFQYLVLYAEPYENVCFAIPNKEVDKPDVEQMSKNYWWHWDADSKEYFLQFMFK